MQNRDGNELGYIKSNLLTQKNIPSDEKKQIENAQTPGEIAIVLFRNGLFAMYNRWNDHMTKNGLMATAEEMNNIREDDNTNGWYWLLKNDKGIKIFDKYVALDITPDNTFFLRSFTVDNKTMLYHLLRSEQGISVVRNYFIPHNRIPSGLDLTMPPDETINIWQQMLLAPHGHEVFYYLLQIGYKPTRADITFIHSRLKQDIWAIILHNQKIFYLLQELLNCGVYPDFIRLYISTSGFEKSMLEALNSSKKYYEAMTSNAGVESTRKLLDNTLDRLNIIIKAAKELKLQYNIEPESEFGSLLIQDYIANNRNYRNFLYFLYQMTCYEPVANLPLKIIFRIAIKMQLALNFHDIQQLMADNKRWSFAGFHTMESLRDYAQDKFKIYTHCDRALTFYDSLRTKGNPRQQILAQWLMSREAGLTFKTDNIPVEQTDSSFINNSMLGGEDLQKYLTPYSHKLSNDKNPFDTFNLILNESLRLLDLIKFNPDYDTSRRMILHLSKKRGELQNLFLTDEKKMTLLQRIIGILKEYSTDRQTIPAVLEYLLHLPILHPRTNKIDAFGNYLELNEEIKLKNVINPVYSGSNVNYIHEIFNNFIAHYRSEFGQWHFTYPPNNDGEIITTQLRAWQEDLMNSRGDRHTTFLDFIRANTITIHGKKAINCNVVLRCSINDISSLKQTCLIRTTEDNAIYFYSNYHHSKPIHIFLDKNIIKLFDDLIKNDSKPRPLNDLEFMKIYHDISMDIAYLIYEANIFDLCHKLNDTENKNLYTHWLRANGGQKIGGFLADSIAEKHFGEHATIGRTTSKSQNWTIKNDKLVCEYSASFNTLISNPDGLSYCKPKNNDFAELHTDQKDSELETILQVDAEIELTITNDGTWSCVKPRLIRYEVSSSAAFTDTFKPLFISPMNNIDNLLELSGQTKTNLKNLMTF